MNEMLPLWFATSFPSRTNPFLVAEAEVDKLWCQKWQLKQIEREKRERDEALDRQIAKYLEINKRQDRKRRAEEERRQMAAELRAAARGVPLHCDDCVFGKKCCSCGKWWILRVDGWEG